MQTSAPAALPVVVEGCWNPATGKNDRKVRLFAEKCLTLAKAGVPHSTELRNLQPTLREPDSVFASADKKSHLYYKKISGLKDVPDVTRRNNPDLLFCVRVTQRGVKVPAPGGEHGDFAYVWDYEDPDPTCLEAPKDQSPDRIGERLR